MTDDRLRAAQERVLREMGYERKRLRSLGVVWRKGSDPTTDLLEWSDFDANFMFGVVIPWARERGWEIDISIYVPDEDGASARIGDMSGRALAVAEEPDPMTALWLALGEAVSHE